MPFLVERLVACLGPCRGTSSLRILVDMEQGLGQKGEIYCGRCEAHHRWDVMEDPLKPGQLILKISLVKDRLAKKD